MHRAETAKEVGDVPQVDLVEDRLLTEFVRERCEALRFLSPERETTTITPEAAARRAPQTLEATALDEDAP